MINDRKESILARARALLALIDPLSNASKGERDNAADALRRHMERHGLTEEELLDSHREWHELACVALRRKVSTSMSKELVVLAMICARYVVGRQKFDDWLIFKGDHFEPVRGMKPDKVTTIWMCRAKLTKAEASDWRECFQHYAPMYQDLIEQLKAEARSAARAKKMAPSAFASKFRLFAPDAKTGRWTSENHLAAMTAYRAASGERWSKKAGHLEE